MQTRELGQVSVTQICQTAKVNRTTFYANYEDIFALADAVQKRLENEVAALYDHTPTHDYSRDNYPKLFRHIRDNQLFYRTYFKLGVDGRFRLAEYDVQQAAAYYGGQNIEYHVEFFRNGLNAVIQMWLKNGCRETPEEIQQIITSEYGPKNIL